jgi:hypothetical protein
MRRTVVVSLCLLLGACAIPNSIEALSRRAPPPEFGRPAWVRFCAGTGAWIGGIVGGGASIVLLPVTWPISEIADDGLGEHAASEFMLFPALTMAAVGHSLFGVPPDLLDCVFRRLWIEQTDPVNTYELIPLEPAVVPVAAPAAGKVVVPEPAPAGDAR